MKKFKRNLREVVKVPTEDAVANYLAPRGLPITPGPKPSDRPVISSMSKSSCSSSMRSRPMLTLLMARSMLRRLLDVDIGARWAPGATELVKPDMALVKLPLPIVGIDDDEAARAALRFVRCNSCVSMLMLACRGLLRPGLSACSPVSEGRCDCAGPGRAPKPELRRGEPTKSELLLRWGANMLV